MGGIIEFGTCGSPDPFPIPEIIWLFLSSLKVKSKIREHIQRGIYIPAEVWAGAGNVPPEDGSGRTNHIPKAPGNNSRDLLLLWESHP